MTISSFHFFVKTLQRVNSLQGYLKNPENLQKYAFLHRNKKAVEEELTNFYFNELKDKAKKEAQDKYVHLLYRQKYNLPPNDPRYLSMTDEEIVYELFLQNEFQTILDNRKEKHEIEELDGEEVKTDRSEFSSSKQKFDELVDIMSRDEDVDIKELVGLEPTNPDDWEPVE